MIWVIEIIILFTSLIIVWFILPISPIKSKFNDIVKESINRNNIAYASLKNEIYTEEDIKNLPISIQKFFRYTGLMGKSKIYISHVVYEDTNFKLAQDKPVMKIKYQHYNLLNNLDRIAYIKTNMMGIPFEGLDNYTNGKGSMTGMIAKSIILFDSKGNEMDESSLVTCLAEMVFLPTVALQDYVEWETIDTNNVKATTEHNGYKVSVIYTINDIGEIIRAETDNRYMDEGNGKVYKCKWVAELSDYIDENGIKHASKAKVIWKLSTGDYTYFEGSGITINYNLK